MPLDENDNSISTGGEIETSKFGKNVNIGSGLLTLNETDLQIQRNQGSAAYQAPNTNRAFSGSDVIAFLVPKAKNATSAPYVPIKNLGAISYSIHRDKVPVRSLGTPRAKSYTLGTRTIAGSMVLINFDRAALSELLYRNNYYGDNIQVSLYDEIPPFDIVLTFSNEHSGKMFDTSTDAQMYNETKYKDEHKLLRADTIDENKDGKIDLIDEAARRNNEISGKWAGSDTAKTYSALTLKNIRLIDEGMVTGVDEAFLETTFQYVAEDIEYLAPVTLSGI